MQNPTSKFHYVYFLTDCATGTHHYVGYTSLKHNIGAGTQEEDCLFTYPLTGHYRVR